MALIVTVSWLAVRDEANFISSTVQVVVEWCAFVACAIVLCKVREFSQRAEIPALLSLLIVIFYSIWHRPEWPDFPMYWRGFGSQVTIGTAVIAAVLVPLVAIHLTGRTDLSRIGRAEEFRRWNFRVGVLTSLWLVPSVLQPMDAWLNIGDSTQIVLEELSGWAVGHIPGYQQASVYSSMLGAPLLVLNAFDSQNPAKITLVVLWANILVLLVPVTIAAIIRKMFTWLTVPAAFSVALISVSISGQTLGNYDYVRTFNTSIFRELSFMSRLLPPLFLAYLLVGAIKSREIRTRHVVLLGSVAGVVAMNNFEFGLGAAGATAVTLAVLTRSQPNRRTLLVQWWAIFVTVWLVALAPVLWIDGSVIRRRLGAFNLLFSGESQLFHAAVGGAIPAFGLIGISFAVASAALGLAMNILLRQGLRFDTQVSAVAALYFSSWVLFSAPYILSSGGPGGFGTQMQFVPLVLMILAIVKLLLSGHLGFIPRSSRESENSAPPMVNRGLSLLPIILLLGLVLAAFLQAPAGYREWRRIQTPVVSPGSPNWVDEWSAEKLDSIEISRVIRLAESFGGVDAVGWWYQHGSAIEMLTEIENLTGVSGFEVIRSKVMLELACEPLVSSLKPYVIAFSGSKSTLDQCEGLEVQQLTYDAEFPLAMFKVKRGQ